MATVNSNTISLTLTSTWTCTWADDDHNSTYVSKASTTDTQSASFSADVPAGATITGRTLRTTWSNTGTVQTAQVDGANLGASVDVRSVSSMAHNYTWRASAAAMSSQGNYSRYMYVSAYIEVTYTPPTAASVSGVTLSGSTAAQYAAAGAGVPLAWNAADGTNNVITSYSVERSDNDGTWYDAGAGWHRTVYAHATPGVKSRWRVNANAPYGSNGWQYSPYIYSYSNPTPPSTVSVTPTTVYTGENVTVSWIAGGAGTGVAISKYELYCNDTKVGETTALSLTVATPSTAGSAVYKVKTIGNVSGYNSALSTASATVTVENPRSTGTLNKSSVEMDGTSTIGLAVTPSNATYNHKVIWYTPLHTETHSLAVGVSTDTLNPVPLAWCTAYPNGASGTANAKLETYNGTTKIGELIYPFTVIVPATVLPTVSALSHAPVDGFTGLYLKGISKATLTATAAGLQGSTIPDGNYSMAGGGGTGNTNPWTTPVLTTIGTNAMSVTVVDTRGRIASRTENITVTDYVNPSISSVLAERCLSDGTANNDGTYVKVKATLAVTSLSGNNPIAVAKVEYRKRGVETWTLGTNAFVNDTYSVVGGNNITTPEAYEIRILLTDTVGKSATHTLIISPSSRLYDFRTDRASIGRIAGTVAKTFVLPDDWTTNIKLGNINGEGKVGTMANLVLGTGTGGAVEAKTAAQLKALMLDINHPVGAIYQSAVSTSPATLFGGTWAAIAAGTFLVAAGTGYTAGSTGGEATHTLTNAEMPSHTHCETGSFNTTPQGYVMTAKNATVGTDVATNSYTGPEGYGYAHNNLPPYLSVYMWERTA